MIFNKILFSTDQRGALKEQYFKRFKSVSGRQCVNDSKISNLNEREIV
jgi:hypothetical protein